jgi:hypothetical protein
MKKLLLALFCVVNVGFSQDSKPASAPATRPTEMTVLGRKVALTVPADWVETKDASSFALEAWKCAKGWSHPKLKGLSIHVYGLEGKDVTPAAMVQKWLENVGRAKPRMLISATGRNKGLKGLDTELELDENGSITLYWLRAIAVSKDKVIAVLAEANPLDYEKIGDVVAVLRPILDSVLDPTGKDRWRRDAEVTVTIDELVARLTAPSGWEYSRLPDSLVWRGPDKQEVELEIPLRSLKDVPQEINKRDIVPMIYKALTQAEEELAKENGKVLGKTPIVGHDQAVELVTAYEVPDEASIWLRKRFFLDGAHIVTVTAQHPIADLTSVPPAAAQKQLAAALESLKIEIKPSSSK